MQFLKQSTSITLRVGPFLDDTDGVTAETALTISQADIRLSKAGAAFAQSNDAGGGTHDENGWYSLTLDATDTNTLGLLTVAVAESGALPVYHDYMILPANAYDSLVAGSDNLEVDAVAISGDSTAADNLELMYDGTGYSDATAPASRSQVSAISSSSGALNFEVEADNTGGAIKSISFVGSQTGTYANTEAEDSVYHTIDDTGNAIDIVYQFDVGGDRIATEASFKGYLDSSNDTLNIQAYDYVGSDWETRAVLTGQNGTDNISSTIPLLQKHTGTSGSDVGKVLIRFQNTGQSGPQLNVDELIVSGQSLAQSVGYAGGAIWVDTNGSNTNTEDFVDGVADNPVSTWAAALTLSGSLGLKKFSIVNGSSITLTGNSDNYFFLGSGWTLALGGQSIASAYVVGATVTGTGTGSAATLTQCLLADGASLTIADFTARGCGIAGDVICSAAGTYYFENCFSGVAGTATPSIDFGAAVGNTNVNFRHYSGGIEVENFGGTGTDNMSLEGFGQVVLNANCSGGALAIRGAFTVTDNAGGAVTLSDNARYDIDNALAAVVESEGTYTAQQVLSIVLAAVAGVTSNDGQTLETPNGNADRIVATVSGNNRTAMTLTPSN